MQNIECKSNEIKISRDTQYKAILLLTISRHAVGFKYVREEICPEIGVYLFLIEIREIWILKKMKYIKNRQLFFKYRIPHNK